MPTSPESSGIRFGVFRLDLESGELYRNDSLIKLPPQPFKVLALLASRAGHLVTREEIQEQIWGNDTFVDFEKALNSCIKQIRAALGDDAESPQYIETLPKRGYRFIAPLDGAGVAARGPSPEGEIALHSAPQSQRKVSRRVGLTVGAVVALAAVAGVAWWLARRPSLPFQERDWVLIASFENRTGEPVFDGTLEYALERELGNSRFVNVVPRERINDTLRLMKKPADTPVTASIGREICLRDGGIRALISGRAEKLDTTYVLSAALVNPANGQSVATFSEEAVGQKEVVPALRRLASRVRKTLGEEVSQIEQSKQKLEKVTTPSLRALQLYSQAHVLLGQGQFEGAQLLLSQALAEDAEFASGHIALARLLWRKNPGGREFQSSAERALQLSETLPERERLFIGASYYHMTGQEEKAIDTYEALLRLFPDHLGGVSYLTSLYRSSGRAREVVPYLVRAAELRPNQFNANLGAAMALATTEKDLARARPYLERARALASSEPPFDLGVVWLRLYPAYESWTQGHLAEVQRQLILGEQDFNAKTGGDRLYVEVNLAMFYLTLGQLRKAEEHFQKIQDASYRHLVLAQVAFARGDARALQQHLLGVPPDYGSPTMAVLYVRAGLLDETEKRIPYFRQRSYADLVRGELALARGRTTEGEALLQESLRQIRGGALNPIYFLGSESLARLYEQQGEVEKALAILETASREKGGVYSEIGPVAYFWMRTQAQLAQLYRKVGRHAEAQAIEAELLKLLAVADPDHPILVELKRLEASAITSRARATHRPRG